MCYIYMHAVVCYTNCQMLKYSNHTQFVSTKFFSACFFSVSLIVPQAHPKFWEKKSISLNPPVWGSWEKPNEEGQLLSMASQFDSKMSVFFLSVANHWQHQMMCTIGFDGINRDIRHRENYWNIKTSTICQRRLNMDSLQALANPSWPKACRGTAYSN